MRTATTALRRFAAAGCLLVACLLLAPAASASASAPAWTITSVRAPTNFTAGNSSGQDSYLVTVTNSGGEPSDGSPITITDDLPASLTPNPAGAKGIFGSFIAEDFTCGAGPPVSCTGSPTVAPGGVVALEVPVDVAAGAPETLTNTVSVSGGGAAYETASEQTTVSATPAPFRFQTFDGTTTNADGSTDTQAGSHPYAMTTTFNFTTASNASGHTSLIASPKNVQVELPPGLVGDPQAVGKCTEEQLRLNEEEPLHGCPIDAQIGVVTLRQSGAIELAGNQDGGTFPVYNMVAPPGRPAELAFVVTGVPVFIDFGVRTGSDYGLTASLSEISAAIPVTGSSLTIWGVPAEESHDAQRCPRIHLATGLCDRTSSPFEEAYAAGVPPAPFLTLASACEGPQSTAIDADSWQEPQNTFSASFLSHDNFGAAVGLDGCDELDFSPSISAQPETATADSPSGFDVDVKLPQNEDPTGLGEPDLRTAVVALPPGVSIDPSAAGGLQACSEAQIDLHSAVPAACPEASRIGSVEVRTPLLAEPLTGWVYVAQQEQNPFGSLLAIYIAVEGDGVVVKLAGHVEANASTGQLTTTFTNNPQLPFSEFKVDLFGGPRAALATPEACGSYQTTSALTPWSAPQSGPPATPGDSFGIGSGCVSGFAPSFTAGAASPTAGAYTPLNLSFSREDSDQAFAGLTVSLPPGLLADVAGVPRCPEAAANAGECPAASQIGTVDSGVGPGPDPFFLPGSVYLTGPYNGGPYGLAVVVPAIAGPYNLGKVVVRQSIRIDPNDAHVTVVSNPFPTIIDGIPLRLRRVDVSIDRPDFVFNPTNCTPSAITATLSSTGGETAPVSSRFQAGYCATLPFKPTFTVTTKGRASKAGGAYLHVKLVPPHEGPQSGTSASGTGSTSGTSGSASGSSAQTEEANIARVKVDLPKQLPSRLTTLQKACTAAVFDANPAACPAASIVASAKAITPILPVPLEGPAYFVSHGNEAFPQLILVLQGYGITIDLVGDTFISKAGITSSTFAHVPDAPVSSFELTLPQGKYSALTANANLCTVKGGLKMPTEFVAQNGMKITESTKIGVTGCPKSKKAKKKPKKKSKAKRRKKS